MKRTQKNFRLPKMTTDQMSKLTKEYGLTETQLVILAMDRMFADARPGKWSDITANEVECTMSRADKPLNDVFR